MRKLYCKHCLWQTQWANAAQRSRAAWWRWRSTVCSRWVSWPLISSAVPPQREVTMAPTEKSHTFLLRTRNFCSVQTTGIFAALTVCAPWRTPLSNRLSSLQMLLCCTEEDDFSIAARMHSWDTTLCSTYFNHVLQKINKTKNNSREWPAPSSHRHLVDGDTSQTNTPLRWHAAVTFDHCWNILQQIR